MLIAQITDLHLAFEPENPNETNLARLNSTLDLLVSMSPTPDLLLLSGDLTHEGRPEGYKRLREALSEVPFPVAVGIGNHDVRSTFAGHFPAAMSPDGFVQYVLEDLPIRIVVADTVEHGRHGGAFCERRARWLEDRLAEGADRPTLLMLHHPPVATGIDWLTTDVDEAWVKRLKNVVSRYSHVVGVAAGHIHRPMAAAWAGTSLIVCPSIAPHVALDLKPMDLDRPDNRALVVADPPGFALHRWRDGALVTHFGSVSAGPTLARYDAAMQPVVRAFAAEHIGSATRPSPSME